jgi:hypothetical protein
MRKTRWGAGLVGLSLVGLLAAPSCSTGPGPQAVWFDKWCAARAECGADLACGHTGAELQARYDGALLCPSAVDSFRRCMEAPDLCGAGQGCGGFVDMVIALCFCGDGSCGRYETTDNCSSDCGAS